MCLKVFDKITSRLFDRLKQMHDRVCCFWTFVYTLGNTKNIIRIFFIVCREPEEIGKFFLFRNFYETKFFHILDLQLHSNFEHILTKASGQVIKSSYR